MSGSKLWSYCVLAVRNFWISSPLKRSTISKMEDFNIGDRFLTNIPGRGLVDVTVVSIREPNRVVNWTSADQSKRVYKLRESGLVNRKYWVRQSNQLRGLVVAEKAS